MRLSNNHEQFRSKYTPTPCVDCVHYNYYGCTNNVSPCARLLVWQKSRARIQHGTVVSREKELQSLEIEQTEVESRGSDI